MGVLSKSLIESNGSSISSLLPAWETVGVLAFHLLHVYSKPAWPQPKVTQLPQPNSFALPWMQDTGILTK